MATVETPPKQNGWGSKRRPFSQWVKRLTNLKGSSSDSPASSSKKSHSFSPAKSKKTSPMKNNPYPESGFPRQEAKGNGHLSFSSPVLKSNGSYASVDQESTDQRRVPAVSTKSVAPTVATNPETVHSETGQSKAETGRSAGGGANSTFSSPNQSERSLTTTLTTIQSTAPSALLNPNAATAAGPATGTSIQFSHQYPVSPASALPPHLAPQSQTNTQPNTYQAATANNMLTDNASILTLASSSKRRRRHSLDTNASVRALAPSSVWGGSRESLPLSVLSDRVEPQNPPTSQSGRQNPNMGGFASAERASVYSSSGVNAPAISSERNSYYASKQVDGASVRSGKLGHGRSESTTGSIGPGNPSSPLASPREPALGRIGRQSSDWRREDSDVEDEADAESLRTDGKPLPNPTS